MAKTIMFLGTGSDVGKSIAAAAFCRILKRRGRKVAPFKAQNMSNNSYVTIEGGEIGRAQVVQAEAAGVLPSVHMNPILLKPSSTMGSQVIVHGKVLGQMLAMDYHEYKPKLWNAVMDSFRKLSAEYEYIVMEGAGSCCEMNLKERDLVNFGLAKAVGSPCVLVADIDRGGVFAQVIGSFGLMDRREKSLLRGFLINKFRGDKRLLKPGIDFLEKKTGIKVLAVIPYFKDIRIPEEDSVSLEYRARSEKFRNPQIDIAVIKLPHISNFTDFDALENEQDVRLRYVTNERELNNPDALIIPGTKSTIADLSYLKKSGLAKRILSLVKDCPAFHLIGICGGYQMMGEKIYDREKTESAKEAVKGLGILPLVTNFEQEKILSQVKAVEINSGLQVTGYEIHHGRTRILKEGKPVFKIIERHGKKTKDVDGALAEGGRVWGTYIHGVFDEDNFRRNFLNKLRLKKGWPRLAQTTNFNPDKEFDKLACLVRENMDMDLLYEIANLQNKSYSFCKLRKD